MNNNKNVINNSFFNKLVKHQYIKFGTKIKTVYHHTFFSNIGAKEDICTVIKIVGDKIYVKTPENTRLLIKPEQINEIDGMSLTRLKGAFKL